MTQRQRREGVAEGGEEGEREGGVEREAFPFSRRGTAGGCLFDSFAPFFLDPPSSFSSSRGHNSTRVEKRVGSSLKTSLRAMVRGESFPCFFCSGDMFFWGRSVKK